MFRSGLVAAIIVSFVQLAHADAMAPNPAPPGEVINSPVALQKLFANNTFTGTIPGFEGSWAEYYCPNGTSIYVYEGHLQLGHWRVQNGRTCFAYDPPGYDKEMCVSAYRQNDGSFVFHSDDVVDSFVQTSLAKPPLPGDPFHLRKLVKYGCDKEPSV